MAKAKINLFLRHRLSFETLSYRAVLLIVLSGVSTWHFNFKRVKRGEVNSSVAICIFVAQICKYQPILNDQTNFYQESFSLFASCYGIVNMLKKDH
jgi:hypothetical protein